MVSGTRAAAVTGLGLLAVLVWSGVAPRDRQVWVLETLPVIVGGGAMALCWRRFPWTPLALGLTALFGLILCVGGHWTYAEVPLGNWARDAFGLSRNHYDRVGHFFQGVIPALLARELLLRRTPLPRGKALFWVCCSIALAISATYELFEWWTTLVAAPEQGAAFMGSQGDEWDAQWDMALALLGSIVVQLAAGRLHDRQLGRLPPG